MSPWVTGLLTRLGRWLTRKIRQVQHNTSHCGVLRWKRIQAESWTCNFVWIQFNGHTQGFHLKEGKQDGQFTCLKHINLGGTWWCCWKVDNATFHASFCLGVGEHKGLIQRQNSVVIP